jgi:hypothetical protein
MVYNILPPNNIKSGWKETKNVKENAVLPLCQKYNVLQ